MTTASPRRKLWLDWQRGAAVLFMIEVHVLDAWLAPGARGAPWPFGLLAAGPSPHAVLSMIGGFAAPGFLFMAGLSQALADAAQERKGIAPSERRTRALRRALWVLAVAYGFRIAEYVLGGAWQRPGGWMDVLKVDVLNIIAVGLAMSAVLSVGRPRAVGASLAALGTIAIVLATPPIAGALQHFDLPAAGAAEALSRQAPGRLADVALAYLYASWPRANFHLFNWAGFLLAGAALAPLALGRARPLAWLALAGALFALGWWADTLPDVYAHQDYWRTSPSWFVMRLAVCVGLSGALQLVPDSAERPLAWLASMGRQSLVGYIASVELTYGALLEWLSWRTAGAPLHRSLSFGATVLAIAVMVAATWAICLTWGRLERGRRSSAASPPAPAH